VEGVDFPISWHIEKNDVKRNNRNINIIQILSEIAHLVRWCLPIIREKLRVSIANCQITKGLNYQRVMFSQFQMFSVWRDFWLVQKWYLQIAMLPYYIETNPWINQPHVFRWDLNGSTLKNGAFLTPSTGLPYKIIQSSLKFQPWFFCWQWPKWWVQDTDLFSRSPLGLDGLVGQITQSLKAWSDERQEKVFFPMGVKIMVN